MRSFYKWGHGVCFSPHVRPVSRYYDEFFQEWFLSCKVTGRNAAHEYHGYKPGQIITARPGSLYAKQSVQRGTFGRLVYSDHITSKEVDSLPVERSV